MKRLFKSSKKNTCQASPFVLNHARRSRKSSTYKSVYRLIAKLIEEFQASRDMIIESDMFTENVAEDYVYFLREKGLANNTIRTYYQKTCYMFRRMQKDGFEVNFGFEYVQVEEEHIPKVALSTDEIIRIYNLNIRVKERDIVRDMFVCNCLTGFRYSDFSELTASNISGNIIVRKTRKTGVHVEVPIHRIVREIINKYEGDFPPYEKSMQNYNKIVKNVCKQAKINEKIFIEHTKGHNVVRKSFKKYELVSSHTARRSFATNAYLAGIPTARIMLITGHTTEQSFFKYVQIGKRENAIELANHSFFSE